MLAAALVPRRSALRPNAGVSSVDCWSKRAVYDRWIKNGSLHLLEKLFHSYFERKGDLFHGPDARFLSAVLQFRQMLPRNLRMIREHGLGPSAFASQDANPPA